MLLFFSTLQVFPSSMMAAPPPVYTDIDKGFIMATLQGDASIWKMSVNKPNPRPQESRIQYGLRIIQGGIYHPSWKDDSRVVTLIHVRDAVVSVGNVLYIERSKIRPSSLKPGAISRRDKRFHASLFTGDSLPVWKAFCTFLSVRMGPPVRFPTDQDIMTHFGYFWNCFH